VSSTVQPRFGVSRIRQEYFSVALSLEGKKTVVAEVAELARNAHSVIAAEYRGLTVAEMTSLRVQARAAAVHVRVVRNTLARRALQDTEYECMSDRLIGPLVLAFSENEPASAARVMRDFAKGNNKLDIKLAAFGGQLIEANQLGVLANLPTRDEALSMLLSVLLAPASKLVRTLAEPHARVVRTLAAVREQREAA
jgi:large subunit ribosomal protein L10